MIKTSLAGVCVCAQAADGYLHASPSPPVPPNYNWPDWWSWHWCMPSQQQFSFSVSHYSARPSFAHSLHYYSLARSRIWLINSCARAWCAIIIYSRYRLRPSERRARRSHSQLDAPGNASFFCVCAPTPFIIFLARLRFIADVGWN